MTSSSSKKDAINLHRILKGKIEIHNRISIDSSASDDGVGSSTNNIDDDSNKDRNGTTLELIYTPGVAYVAKEL